MRIWRVKRGDEMLGNFLAERLELRDGELVAMRGKRVKGSVASGPNLSWEAVPWPGDEMPKGAVDERR